MNMPSSWTQMIAEPAALAIESLRTERARSVLAVAGVVIGIVTVVLTASILANARNQVALLFRDLGTENVFAFHLTGDPYVTPNETEAGRRPLKLEFVRAIKQMGTAVRDVGAQVIVPTAVEGQVLVARAGGNESDTVLVEGVTASLFDIIGADFARGRPFTDLEDREGAQVAVVGANLGRGARRFELEGRQRPGLEQLLLPGELLVGVAGARFGRDNVSRGRPHLLSGPSLVCFERKHLGLCARYVALRLHGVDAREHLS